MADTQDKPQRVELESPLQQEQESQLSLSSIGRFLVTRIPTLVPPMHRVPNPIKALTLLNKQQWLFFGVCRLFLRCPRSVSPSRRAQMALLTMPCPQLTMLLGSIPGMDVGLV